MIAVTQADVGRRVRYLNRRRTLDAATEAYEEGVITSFSSLMVFVLYEGEINSKGTSARDLEYVE